MLTCIITYSLNWGGCWVTLHRQYIHYTTFLKIINEEIIEGLMKYCVPGLQRAMGAHFGLNQVGAVPHLATRCPHTLSYPVTHIVCDLSAFGCGSFPQSLCFDPCRSDSIHFPLWQSPCCIKMNSTGDQCGVIQISLRQEGLNVFSLIWGSTTQAPKHLSLALTKIVAARDVISMLQVSWHHT